MESPENCLYKECLNQFEIAPNELNKEKFVIFAYALYTIIIQTKRIDLGKLRYILQNNDIVLAIGLVTIVLMMVIPIPAQILDLLLTLNISLSVLILLVCLYTKEPLEYSSFPTILLMATLFRLGLNVTSTRLILLQANAGSVISSFGQFVIGGNYVVGFVIFIDIFKFL